MTQEDKEILLKDLCARLPYNIRVEYKGKTHSTIYDVLGVAHGRLAICLPFMSYTEHPLVEEVKPYLLPLSSMTEQQKEELKNEISKQTDILIERMKNDDCGIDCGKYHFHSLLELEWLLKNHFDYRGLIPKGLAIDATGKNIY